MQHGGSGAGYEAGCRCDECRAANATRVARRRTERAAEIIRYPGLAPHGKVTTYDNWGCRCAPCKTAKSEANAYYNARRKRA